MANAGVTPNGAIGRIVLAKPALTGNTAENLHYQGWLYAAVENSNGTFAASTSPRTAARTGPWSSSPTSPGTALGQGGGPHQRQRRSTNSYDPTSSKFNQAAAATT